MAKKIKSPFHCAVIWVESRFDPKAKSHKGAIGLYQQIPRFADNPKEFKRKYKDVVYATKQFNSSYSKWFEYSKGNKVKALAHYNAGYNYKYGIKYAKDVLRAEQEFKKLKQKGII